MDHWPVKYLNNFYLIILNIYIYGSYVWAMLLE